MSTVEEVLVQYHGSDFKGIVLLDFNTEHAREKNEHVSVSEHTVHSFSFSCPRFPQKRSLRPFNSVWQLFLSISYVNNYSHF